METGKILTRADKRRISLEAMNTALDRIKTTRRCSKCRGEVEFDRLVGHYRTYHAKEYKQYQRSMDDLKAKEYTLKVMLDSY